MNRKLKDHPFQFISMLSLAFQILVISDLAELQNYSCLASGSSPYKLSLFHPPPHPPTHLLNQHVNDRGLAVVEVTHESNIAHQLRVAHQCG